MIVSEASPNTAALFGATIGDLLAYAQWWQSLTPSGPSQKVFDAFLDLVDAQVALCAYECCSPESRDPDKNTTRLNRLAEGRRLLGDAAIALAHELKDGQPPADLPPLYLGPSHFPDEKRRERLRRVEEIAAQVRPHLTRAFSDETFDVKTAAQRLIESLLPESPSPAGIWFIFHLLVHRGSCRITTLCRAVNAK